MVCSLIDKISEISYEVQTSYRSDRDTVLKVLKQASNFFSECEFTPETAKGVAGALSDLENRIRANQEIDSTLDAISMLTDEISSSIVEVVPGDSGGFCLRRCTPRFANGEFFYTSVGDLTREELEFDLPGYPSQARYVSEYLEQIDRFSGHVEKKPSTLISYFLSSTTMNAPGTVVVDGVEKGSKIRCRSQVENDLGRATTVTIAKEQMYGPGSQHDQKKVAAKIMEKLRDTFKNNQMATSISQLMTQATIAGASTDFLLRFTNQPLECGFYNPERIDIVVRNQEENVEVSYYLLYHIRDLTLLPETGKMESLPIFRSCVLRRKITLPKESLKDGSSKGGEAEDSYSKFFGIAQNAEKYLLNEIKA